MVEMVPTKLDRVRDHTAEDVNAKIDREIEESVRAYAGKSEQVLTRRINELDREWDMERILEANASTLALIGTMLGAFINPWFLVIPVFVTSFLLLHATHGWCPPVPMFRRMGKRTRNEIDAEKFAMKALRGDFSSLQPISDRALFAERVIDAIRR